MITAMVGTMMRGAAVAVVALGLCACGTDGQADERMETAASLQGWKSTSDWTIPANLCASSPGRDRATVEYEIGKYGGLEVREELFREMAAWVEMAVGRAPDFYWLQQYPK